MSGVFFALRGVRILAFRRLSPEGRCPIRLLEWRKKRDSAGKRTDLKAPGKRCQLRQDCFGAQYVRQYSCASDRQQAAIVFDVAVDMVKQSPALMKRIKIIPSTKRMVYQPTGSIYQVLSSEVATKHGLNVSACIFDELHTQPTRALYDVMTQGSGDARKQPLWFFLTTAGTDRNSICWEVHQKAVDIIEDRKVDPRFYPVIFGLPDEADWTSEENWYKANPSLGETITIR